MLPFLHGTALGASLIVAIGPQNLFVLSEATTPRRAALLTTVCGLCDTLLMILGSYFYSYCSRWVGAPKELCGAVSMVFLLWYTATSLKSSRAALPTSMSEITEDGLLALASRAIGFSLMNPLAILDTVAIIAGTAQTYPPLERAGFLAGSICMSWLWFSLLAFASSVIRKSLSRNTVSRLSLLSASLMLALALKMLFTM